MNSLVGDHVTREFRVEAARLAGEIFLGRVRTRVYIQVLFEAEGFRAAVALVDFLRGVYLEVRQEILFHPASEGAKRALVRRFVEMLRSMGDQLGYLVYRMLA